MKDLLTKEVSELKKMIGEKKEELRKFRFGVVNGKTKNTKEAHTIKKDIARVLTAINSKMK